MRTPARTGTTIAAAAVSLTLALTLGVGSAAAKPGGGDGAGDGKPPTQAQVDQARKDVRSKARSVAAIRGDLGSAQQALDAADIAAAQASETYSGALWDLGLAKQAVRKADRRATRLASSVTRQRSKIARMVVQNFRGGTQLDQLSIVLDADATGDVLSRDGAVHSASTSMDARYDAYRASLSRARIAKVKAATAKKKAARLSVVAEHARDRAVSEQRAAAGRTASLEARTAQLTRELATAQHVSTALAGKRARAIRLAAARAAAARAARAAAAAAAKAPKPATTPRASDSGGDQGGSQPADPAPPAPSAPPAPGGGAGAAIAFAKAQLGEPYSWGATGPSSWDCSGLMLMAWRAGGKSLPRTSRQQYAATAHIGRSQLQPGDLLFWGSSPGSIYHVAMYLGDNMMIQAPRTGRDVEIVSVDYWIAPSYFSRP